MRLFLWKYWPLSIYFIVWTTKPSLTFYFILGRWVEKFYALDVYIDWFHILWGNVWHFDMFMHKIVQKLLNKKNVEELKNKFKYILIYKINIISPFCEFQKHINFNLMYSHISIQIYCEYLCIFIVYSEEERQKIKYHFSVLSVLRDI